MTQQLKNFAEDGETLLIKKLDLNKKVFNEHIEGNEYTALVIDTEATSLDRQNAKLTSFAGILFTFDKDFRILEIKDTFYFLNDPKEKLTEENMKITGLTNEMLEGHDIAEHVDYIRKNFYDKARYVIAHNAAYDIEILRNNKGLLKGIEDPSKWICSIFDARWAEKFTISSSKLDYLAFYCGFWFEGHDALIDCYALLNVLSYGDFFQNLLTNKLTYRTIEVYDTKFNEKDILKSEGYLWNGDKKCWWKKTQHSDTEKQFIENNLSSYSYNVY